MKVRYDSRSLCGLAALVRKDHDILPVWIITKKDAEESPNPMAVLEDYLKALEGPWRPRGASLSQNRDELRLFQWGLKNLIDSRRLCLREEGWERTKLLQRISTPRSKINSPCKNLTCLNRRILRTLGLAFLETCWDPYRKKDRKEEMMTHIFKRVVVGGEKDMQRFLRWRNRVAIGAKDGNLDLDRLNAISYRYSEQSNVRFKLSSWW